MPVKEKVGPPSAERLDLLLDRQPGSILGLPRPGGADSDDQREEYLRRENAARR